MRFYGYKYGIKLFHLGGVQGEAGRKRYPWGNDPKLLNAWRTGTTGFPFIDGELLCYVMSCYVMSCYVMLCYVMLHSISALS